MRLSGRGFHTLDKDLGRITHAETAQLYAFRPLLRLGFAILLLVALLVLWLGVTGRQPGMVGMGAGLIVASWLGLAMGGNDVANSLGPAFGAGAIGLLPGVLLVALAEIGGASLAGGPVTQRLSGGLFDAGLVQAAGSAQLIMLAALIGAAVWITLATGAGLPVSTTHSIVGAIAGASVAGFGIASLEWLTLLRIASVWVVAPVAAGVLAAAVLSFITLHVAEAPDRAAAGRLWLPLLVGAMSGFFVAYLGILLARRIEAPEALLMAPAPLVAMVTGALMRRRLIAEQRAAKGRPRMKYLFRPPLVGAAVLMGFAHGANDVGSIAGPLAVILSGPQTGDGAQISPMVLVLAGAMIAVGTVLFGRRLVVMVGSGITRLNPVRAFCITLATATTVLTAATAGLPVSTTHVAIGGIFGVGFAREWLDRRANRQREALPAAETRRRVLIRRSHVVTISMAWVITLPMTAMLSAGVYLLITAATGA